MNLYKKLSFLIAVSFIMASLTSLSSCRNRHLYKDWSKTFKGELKNRAKEKDINYFFVTGFYDISTQSLEMYVDYIDDHVEDWDKYPDYPKGFEAYIDPEDLETNNVVDIKGNIVDIRPFLKLVPTEDGYMYTNIKNIHLDNYNVIKEHYGLFRGESSGFYCKEPQSEILSEDLIFDDNLVIRLYDKNNQIIDESKMRNRVYYIEKYKKDPKSQKKKMSDGVGQAHLIGMLKLPPKHKRKGLKYRVLRLDKEGKPLIYYRSPEENKPPQYYLFEKKLPAYSDYKYWFYTTKGCYFNINLSDPSDSDH